jgi:hypothetical protein
MSLRHSTHTLRAVSQYGVLEPASQSASLAQLSAQRFLAVSQVWPMGQLPIVKHSTHSSAGEQ